MTTLNIYLHFNGQAEAAFNYYKSVFGGEFSTFQRYKDIPGNAPNPEDKDGNRVLHVSMQINKDALLMGSDGPSSMQMVMGENFSISVNPDSEAEATRIFNALADGGHVKMPLEKTFWNAYFGMCTDQFGVNWMVNYELK